MWSLNWERYLRADISIHYRDRGSKTKKGQRGMDGHRKIKYLAGPRVGAFHSFTPSEELHVKN